MYAYQGAVPAPLVPSAVSAVENTLNSPSVSAVEPGVLVPVTPCSNWIWIALVAAIVGGIARRKR